MKNAVLIAICLVLATLVVGRDDPCATLSTCEDCTQADVSLSCNWCFVWSGTDYCYGSWNSTHWCHGSARGYLGTCSNVSIGAAIGISCGVFGFCIIVAVALFCFRARRNRVIVYQQIPPQTQQPPAPYGSYQVPPQQPYQAPPPPFYPPQQQQQQPAYGQPAAPGGLYPTIPTQH